VPDQPTVLHLIDSFHKGGSESQAVQLVRLLKGIGRYRVLIACLNKDGPLRNEIESVDLDKIPEYKLTGFYNLQTLRQLRRFAAYLKNERVVILHTHDFYTNVFGMWAGAVTGVPVRIAARRESSGMRSVAKRALERFSYRAAIRVVANCAEVRHQLTQEGVSAKKIEVIYNGVDASRICHSRSVNRSEIAASFGLPIDPGRRFISMVANLRLPVKDHATFLRAARTVSEVAPLVTFVIAGEGELMNSMRLLAKELGITRQTFFLGGCDRVAELLSITEIGVLSSLYEGFPNAVLEYMAAGCPVVATDVGGIGEAVADGQTGYLVEARDHEAMARKILRLLEAPEQARAMGILARRIVAERFSSEAQAKTISALYERLLPRILGRALRQRGEANAGNNVPSVRPELGN
jgi:glycosyltransferase involved in cell wall biosynthesis